MRAVEVGSQVFDLAQAARAKNAPPEVVSHLVRHEGDHAMEDSEGYGVFGLLLITAVLKIPEITYDHIRILERHIEIVAGAFYLPIGERTPETMAKIAAAPGFSDMSDQDWNVYNRATSEARREWQKEAERDGQSQTSDNPVSESDDEEQQFGPGARGVIYPHSNTQEDYASLPLAA